MIFKLIQRSPHRLDFVLGRKSIHSASTKSWILKDDMSTTHAKRLDLTLTPFTGAPENHISNGVAAFPGSHLVYFNHAVSEHELNADGYDDLQAPKAGTNLVRRWLKGKIEFSKCARLVLGHNAECKETLANPHEIEGSKRNKHAVTITREITQGSSEPCIKESRTLFYFEPKNSLRQKLVKLMLGKEVDSELASLNPAFTHDFVVSNILIFRYSALSFNAHLIHYDPVYAQQAEGLPSIIAQGPLLVTLLLQWFQTKLGPQDSIKSIDYENVGSVLVNDRVKLNAAPIGDNAWKVWITRDDQNGWKLVFRSNIIVH